MLKFFYGVMNSSKTAQALIQNYNYQHLNIKAHTYLLKPQIDTRSEQVSSRIGLKAPCISFSPSQNIFDLPDIQIDIVLGTKMFIIIDEAQFCTSKQVEQLRSLADDPNIDVFCYGLKTNFKAELFEGSKRLLELADYIEEIPHLCSCGKKALINARFLDHIIQKDGEEIQIGDTEYKPLCHSCYMKNLEKAKTATKAAKTSTTTKTRKRKKVTE